MNMLGCQCATMPVRASGLRGEPRGQQRRVLPAIDHWVLARRCLRTPGPPEKPAGKSGRDVRTPGHGDRGHVLAQQASGKREYERLIEMSALTLHSHWVPTICL